MQPVLTAAQMAELDRYTIEHLGLDGRVLMSNAAREVLGVIRSRFPHARRPVIFAGTGNNGGDGVALAYYAQQDGYSSSLVLCHPQITDPPVLSADSAYFHRICTNAYLPVKSMSNPALVMEVAKETGADLVVDALFGTGLDRPLAEYYLSLIERINHLGLPVLAIDCPSGLNCTNGAVMGGAVHADITVTMGYAKRGFFHPAAGDYLGQLITANLGFANLVDAGVNADAHAWPEACWEPLTRPRLANTHKGHYGKLLIIAGNRKYTGAPRLAARAALRTGAGLVRLVVPGPIHAICCDDPAVMVASHPCDSRGGFHSEPSEELLEYLDWADALVIGPGMSDAPEGVQLVRELLNQRDLPVVLDADGLRAMWHITQGTGTSVPTRGPQAWPVVLTPHAGELAHLAGVTPAETLEHWFDVASLVAEKLEALVLAKSSQSVIALPAGGLIFPRHGDPALATGGTGDVLAGILGALLARYHAVENLDEGRSIVIPAMRKMHAAEITATAVNIHALASQCGVAELGENGLTATDLVEFIPAGISALCNTAIADKHP